MSELERLIKRGEALLEPASDFRTSTASTARRR